MATVAKSEPKIELQRMPHIWDDTEFYTSKKAIVGALAKWAIIQMPTSLPELNYSIAEFSDWLDSAVPCTMPNGIFKASCRSIEELLRTACDSCNVIQAWNVPVPGNSSEFIDLNALLRNVAHDITVREKYDHEHDKN